MKKLLLILLLPVLLISCSIVKSLKTTDKGTVIKTGKTVVDTTSTVKTTTASTIDTTKSENSDITITHNNFTVAKDTAGNPIAILSSQDIINIKKGEVISGKAVTSNSSDIKRDGITCADSTSTNKKDFKVEEESETSSKVNWYLYIFGAFSAVVIIFLARKYLPLIRTILNV